MKYYDGSQSEAGQESFVLSMLDEKQNGFYIEIGAFSSTVGSNTLLLETAYGWKGLGFEIDQTWVNEYNANRRNPCICADATTYDYLACFKYYEVPKRVDYLQLDIDPAVNTLQALKQLPLNDYRFSVITFEHDLYSGGDNAAIKQEQIEILSSLGYVLAANNVKVDDHREFEDWWIDPAVIAPEKYSDLKLKY
jgi:hypothetical protein